MVFSVLSMLRSYKQEELLDSAWGYNSAAVFLEDINTETTPSRLAESQIWDSKI